MILTIMLANRYVDVSILWLSVLMTAIIVSGSSDAVDRSTTTMAAAAGRIPSTAADVAVDPDRQPTTADDDEVNSDWAVWSSTDQPRRGGGLYMWTPDGSPVGYRVLAPGEAAGGGSSGAARRSRPKALNPVAVSVTLHRSPPKSVNRVEASSTKTSTGAEVSEEQHLVRMRRKQYRLYNILKQVNDQIGRGVVPPSRNYSRSAPVEDDDDDDVSTDDSSSTLSAAHSSSSSTDEDPCVRDRNSGSGGRRTSRLRGEVRLRRSRRRHVTDAGCAEVGGKARTNKKNKNKKETAGSGNGVDATSSDAAYTITSTCARRPVASSNDDKKRFNTRTDRNELVEIKGDGRGLWIDFNVSSHCATTTTGFLTFNIYKKLTSAIIAPTTDASTSDGTGAERGGVTRTVRTGGKRRQTTAGKKIGDKDDKLVLTVYQMISRPGRGKTHKFAERLRQVGKARTRHSHTGWMSVEMNNKFAPECHRQQLALYVQLVDRATGDSWDPRTALDLPPLCDAPVSPGGGSVEGLERVRTADSKRPNNLPYLQLNMNKSQDQKSTAAAAAATTTTSRQQHHRRRRHRVRTTLNERF